MFTISNVESDMFRKFLNPTGSAMVNSEGNCLTISDCGRSIYLDFENEYFWSGAEFVDAKRKRKGNAEHKRLMKKLNILRAALDDVESYMVKIRAECMDLPTTRPTI